MAQLKDTLVTGDLRVTDNTTTDSLQVTTINAKTGSSSTTYGPGTSGQVLKSNGSAVYWTTDENNYDRLRYQQSIKASTSAITAGNIIVANSTGLYYHLKSGNAFDIRFPILYAASNIAASSTGTNNYIVMRLEVTTTQSMTFTAYQPVYIKGALSGSGFTPVSTAPLTQTVPTTKDGYHYMLLGIAYNSNAMYLLDDHRIFEFSNGYFRLLDDDSSAICDDAANIQHKAARFDSYVLRVNNIFQLSICNGNSYAGTWTLNVNGTGAKTVYINGSITSSSNYSLSGGIYNVIYCSDGNYHLSTAAFPIPDSGFRGRYTQGPINICCRQLGQDLKTAFKTNVLGQTGNHNFISAVRCSSSTATTDISPAWSSAIAFGYGDTHAYLNIGYGGNDNDKKVFVAGGNFNALLWDARVFTTADPPKTTEIVPGSSTVIAKYATGSVMPTYIKLGEIIFSDSSVFTWLTHFRIYVDVEGYDFTQPQSIYDIMCGGGGSSSLTLKTFNISSLTNANSSGGQYFDKIIINPRIPSNYVFDILLHPTSGYSSSTIASLIYEIDVLENMNPDVSFNILATATNYTTALTSNALQVTTNRGTHEVNSSN